MSTPSANENQLRFPLLLRILGWLLLNLLLLGTLLYAVLQVQFKLGIASLIAGPAGDRILALSSAVGGALVERPPEDWDSVLENFSNAYKVRLALYDLAGNYVAGAPAELPDEVRGKLAERRGPGEQFGIGKGFGGMGPGRGKGPAPLEGPPPGREPLTLFSLATHNPTLYWVAVRLPPPVPMPDSPRRPVPLVLILMTNSLYSGTLFLNLKLWFIAGLVTLVVTILLWTPPVRGLTRAISQLTRATDAIAQGDFAVRVNARRTDEVGHLGRSVNRMAERLDGFVTGQKRFLGDIAHELCSPLARMQVGLGILEQSAGPDQREAVQDVRDEVEEMSQLINELLSFSKASFGRNDAPLEPVRLAEVVGQVLRREGLLNTVRVGIDEQIFVRGRGDLLRRAVANLVRNAKRYAGDAGPIDIGVSNIDGHVLLRVSDQGNGVPEPELQRIFDPFYRAEPSRSRETGGAGLGLAIVKSCVEACGGSVQARNLQPRGFEVVMRLLPVEEAPEAPILTSGQD